MTYIIVKDRHTIIGSPFESFAEALEQASTLYGDDVEEWIDLNLRVEENRPQCDGIHIA